MKRTVIDLVSSDDEGETRAKKLPRSTNDSGYYSQTQSSSQLDIIDDEEDADELIMWSHDDGATNETFERYGTIQTKIVGLRYYNGHATVGEHVVVRREPSNRYDSNAIRVDNVQRAQV